MAKNTRVKARNANNEISVSHSEVDTPVLDVNAIERLHDMGRNDIVDFILDETKKEAENRRKNVLLLVVVFLVHFMQLVMAMKSYLGLLLVLVSVLLLLHS